MGISAEKYFKKVGAKKEIELPSGCSFTIRKVQGRELVGENMPFSTVEDLKGLEKDQVEERFMTMDADKRKEAIDFNDMLINKALVEPDLTKDQIKDIPPEDYNKLIEEVTQYSFGKIKDVSPTKGTATS